MKAKTKQQGYWKLKPADKWCHFSMNCWVNLKQDSGKSIGDLGKVYEGGDLIDQFIILSELAYAALKANDQEEGNEIDYNIFSVRNWMNEIGEEDSMEFLEAMTASLNLGNKKGQK